MVIHHREKSFTVRQAGKGWIFEWFSPLEPDCYRKLAGMWPQPEKPPESGVEVFVDKKALSARIKSFLGF